MKEYADKIRAELKYWRNIPMDKKIRVLVAKAGLMDTTAVQKL